MLLPHDVKFLKISSYMTSFCRGSVHVPFQLLEHVLCLIGIFHGSRLPTRAAGACSSKRKGHCRLLQMNAADKVKLKREKQACLLPCRSASIPMPSCLQLVSGDCRKMQYRAYDYFCASCVFSTLPGNCRHTNVHLKPGTLHLLVATR